ncbi:hypothetical protein [Oerskovia enterophila]|uniref:Uncharacterized protein n=1 Tax=Oerskovia enterophila TaxID=43678 RepID=A0A163QXX1_9CELL|nr:hypothetical protein [Oerskovia enterophila]KZM34650.1 hypothetical protein OJAG_26850 [Oerskovia enterophila]OCI32955.1 hypothetical protein OERS_02090 [Oerskovia enterophila]
MVHPIELVPVDAETFDDLDPGEDSPATETAEPAPPRPRGRRVFPLLAVGILLGGVSYVLRILAQVFQAHAVDRFGNQDLSTWQYAAGNGAATAHVLTAAGGAAVLTVTVLRAARALDALGRSDAGGSHQRPGSRWLVVVVACVVVVAVIVANAFPQVGAPGRVIVQDVQSGQLSIVGG